VIQIAVIGAGHWGPNLIRNFYNRRTSRVAWVIDKDSARLAQVNERFPEIRTSTDAAVALQDASINAVVISTPTVTHYALTKAALESGKHVLVEKPLTTRASEGEELRALAQAQGRILMVGHVFLYNPGVRKVHDILHGGEFGRVYYVSMVRTNLGPIRTDVNAAWDLAAQDISIANYWFAGQPIAVSSVGGAWINEGIADTVFATLRYPPDVLVHIHVSWLHPRKARDITVVGERQMLTLDDMNLVEPLRIYDKRVTEDRRRQPWVDSFAAFRSSLREGDVLIPRLALGEPLRDECEHFIRCIQAGDRPLTDAAQGIAVVRALEALDRSAHNGGREEQV
jgi:predicted dehydrogenase